MAVSRTEGVLRQWQSQLQGRILSPDDEGYEAARRVWNGMIDRRPAVIVRCASAADVRTAVKLARTEQMHVSVRGGGHSVAGLAVCDGGLMIDLSRLKQVAVDSEKQEATAQAGALWGEFDSATEAHRLATTGGQVSHTGIGGLTLGGGLGYLMSKHGSVCDNLLSVDMVTADGEMLTASAQRNPDLFWAIRGAGSNFGIVTSFRYRLHPLNGVVAGMVLHPLDRAREFIDFYREFVSNTPDELDTTLGFLTSPDGIPLVGAIVVYAGDVDAGEQLLAPLRKFGPPAVDLVRPMPYTQAQSMVDGAVPIGDRYYWKSNFVPELVSGLTEVLAEGARERPSPHSLILLFQTKGKIRRVPKEDMAFDHRDANFELSIIARWSDPTDDAPNIHWAREVWRSAQPFVSTAVYANHMTADETQDRVRAAYGPDKYVKLSLLKKKYDPTNFFSQNHNIPPVI